MGFSGVSLIWWHSYLCHEFGYDIIAGLSHENCKSTIWNAGLHTFYWWVDASLVDPESLYGGEIARYVEAIYLYKIIRKRSKVLVSGNEFGIATANECIGLLEGKSLLRDLYDN